MGKIYIFMLAIINFANSMLDNSTHDSEIVSYSDRQVTIGQSTTERFGICKPFNNLKEFIDTIEPNHKAGYTLDTIENASKFFRTYFRQGWDGIQLTGEDSNVFYLKDDLMHNMFLHNGYLIPVLRIKCEIQNPVMFGLYKCVLNGDEYDRYFRALDKWSGNYRIQRCIPMRTIVKYSELEDSES